MGNKKLTINLVTWNGGEYLPYLFDSLAKQTNKNWNLVVVDNGSTDGTLGLLETRVPQLGVDFQIVKNHSNVGFAAGHNQAWQLSNAEYLLIINQDIFLAPDCVEKMLAFMVSHPHCAAAAPRVMKWDFANKIFTNKIDSLGLKVYHSRRVVEIDSGLEYENHFESFSPVFGVSGAVAIFSGRALDAVENFFDADLNSYKEDVDLAYRLNSLGWEAMVLLDAVAYHDRAGSGAESKNDFSAAANKIKQSAWVRYHSYKNHLAVLYKNEYWQNFILDLPFILWYELKKFVYFLLFDRAVLNGLKELWSQRSVFKIKRANLIKQRHLDWKQMRKKIYV